MKQAARMFTPAEATQTLPLVRRIVDDILEKGRRARRLQAEDAPREQVAPLVRDIEAHVLELEELGCSFKDWRFEVGLVDFPSVIDGEPVLLCWRSDEPALSHYHGLTDGYAGRKPIPPDLLLL